ncbi:type IV secretion protein Rhs [Flavobacterium sp. GA093]|uniref:Type IV secretion protein Rhs n=1 Tax=Flavobacterium hydrocarbonoxydans TaxID=2683249 RepID=A0A6I4NXY5_9FLAO|nr:phage baseplate assembly protein V [Flavobacterium hydrocarbonoxydans]MWB96619.1 type IV secretion protein Rhs [Flavobacterium hydrocarbonoxydans]
MGKFADQVHISVTGFQKQVIHSKLRLEQKMNEHHHFSFMWHYTGSIVIKPEEQFKQIQMFNGGEVIFTFKTEGGTKLMSKGIITKTMTQYRNGSPVGLHVTGVSHTAVLNDLRKTRIFKNQTLEEIALDIFSKEGPGEFYQQEAIKPTYTKRFDAIAQNNETNFEFLKRMAIRYGQWFYFDGMRMQFGQLKQSKIKLINGSSLHNFGIETVLESHKTSLSGYDFNTANTLKSHVPKTPTGSQDSLSRVITRDQAQIVYSHDYLRIYGSYTSQAHNSAEIEEMVKMQAAAKDAGSVFYTGMSHLPLGLGQVFNIKEQEVPRDLVVIEVTHLSTGRGNYCCEFVAIPSDVYAPPYTDVEIFSRAEMQPAKVTDNKDEAGLGRVKVRFNWSGDDKNESDWIRLIQPHGGAGKGFYYIPEIGEEVMVGFDGGDIDRPIVMGAHYNGIESSGYYTPNNDNKVIQTKSGCKVIINDAEGSLLTEDAAGSKVFQDGKGNIDIDAPKNISFTAGDDILINAGKNIRTTVGLDKIDTIGRDHSEDIKGTKNISVGIDFFVRVMGSLKEFVKGKIESHTEKERKEFGAKGVDTSSHGTISKHAQKDLRNNSGERTTYN